MRVGIGGGEVGGVDGRDGGGVGQGEGWSRSGARVADDSSVSSKCPRFLRGVDLEQRVYKVGST